MRAFCSLTSTQVLSVVFYALNFLGIVMKSTVHLWDMTPQEYSRLLEVSGFSGSQNRSLLIVAGCEHSRSLL